MNRDVNPWPARRRFVQGTVALGAALASGSIAFAAAPPGTNHRRLLILVELKGGNDGLNTLIPYADPSYRTLRPKIGIARDAVVQLSDTAALHPSLAPLLPSWERGELAVLQGVGYPAPNLSHFRSIEIWDTASKSDEHLADGWLARAFAATPPPATFAADGVVVGSNELGPLAGGGPRAIALADTESFLRRARLASGDGASGNRALAHIRKVEGDIRHAAERLAAPRELATSFPRTAFGNAIRAASQVIANPAGVAAVRVTLDGFDTHANQPATHARLLGDLAAGLVALRSALDELGRLDDALVLTYAEFGRRAKENESSGTDHGTASVHFAMGGRVQGGFHGAAPRLDRLGADGNVAHTTDFRSLYATALERWWGVPSAQVLGGRYEPLAFVRA